jgi:hypothetical protein
MRPLATLFGGRHGTVTVTDEAVEVRYGVVFSIDVPRVAVRTAERVDLSWWWGVGAHGWKRRWVVNGSRRQLVELGLDPEVRGRTFGLGVRVRSLVVSVEDAAGLIAAVGSDPADR